MQNINFTVGGNLRNIYILKNDDNIEDLIGQIGNSVIFWRNEKQKKNFFLTKIEEYFYVLACKIDVLFGIYEISLVKIIDHEINNNNYDKILRWRKGVKHIPGNPTKDINMYVNYLEPITNIKYKPLVLKCGY